jgi:glycosyltransferase involved in cell wall biosynthesis
VAPDRPGEVARAVRVLLDFPDRATAMGAAGRARVSERFSWEASVAALGDVYASLERGWIGASVPEGSVP